MGRATRSANRSCYDTMNIRVLSADALTPAQTAAWADIQRADAALGQPLFPARVHPGRGRGPRRRRGRRARRRRPAGRLLSLPARRGQRGPAGGRHDVRFPRRHRPAGRGLGPAATAPRLRPGGLALRPPAGLADAACGLSLERRPLAVPRSLARLGRLPGRSARRSWAIVQAGDAQAAARRARGRTAARRTAHQPRQRLPAPDASGRSSSTAAPASPTCSAFRLDGGTAGADPHGRAAKASRA